jgi:hypothetical protein
VITANHPISSGYLVDHPALLSDLAVGAGLDSGAAHLHHRRLELGLPQPRRERVVPHHVRRLVRRQQRGVRPEQHLVVEHVPVVLAVQAVGCHEVLRHRRVAAAAAALIGQRGGERGVHVRGVGWEAVGEGRAVGAADGVRAGERDHVLGVEPLGGEHVLELLQAGERRRQVGEGLAVERHAPVVAAARHVEVDRIAAEEVGGVAAGEGDDVRARDDAGAGILECRLGRVDHLEAAQAQVGRAGPLRGLGGASRVQENRSIAPLNEAVMEEQTDEAGARATVTVRAVLHGLPDDAFRIGARVLVVADTKP